MYWLSSYRALDGEVMWKGGTLEGLDIINIQIYSMEVGRKGKMDAFQTSQSEEILCTSQLLPQLASVSHQSTPLR
jgi:hypothetical protein